MTTEAPKDCGSSSSPSAAQQMPPISVALQNPELIDNGPGLYAVPFPGPMVGSYPCTLIPIKYKIPSRENSAGVAGQEAGQEARQQNGPQRQVVVRRFQFAIQLDLALIIKLAAAVFLFNQEGSRQRLIILVFFATLVYLHQTGVLRPLIRWIQQGAGPPRPRPAAQADNRPPVGQGRNEQPEENAGVDQNHDVNQPEGAEDVPPAVNENQPEGERANQANWGIMREIRMIVVGFITSLLPGFHHND